MTRLLPALVVLLFVGFSSWAHEPDEPFAPYYGSLHTKSGGDCCGGPGHHDCGPALARLTQEGWEAFIDDAWVKVPEEAVLQRDNPTSEATVCVYFGRILCFVPGNET